MHTGGLDRNVVCLHEERRESLSPGTGTKRDPCSLSDSDGSSPWASALLALEVADIGDSHTSFLGISYFLHGEVLSWEVELQSSVPQPLTWGLPCPEAWRLFF